MKVTTKFFVVALILSLIFAVSAVAAAEDISFDQSDSEEVLQETDMELDQGQDNIDDKLSVSEADDDLNSPTEEENQLSSGSNTVTGENFTDIQTVIDSAQAGETIFLDGKTYKGSSLITVDKGLIIDGGSETNGDLIATLDAQELSMILYVTASNVVIKNINFINGKTSSGGAIYCSGANGIIENCNFTNNKATGDYSYGGAVYFRNTGNVTNCNFTDNTASSQGGAVYFYEQGTVTNCNFTGNTATGNGGAVYFNINGEVTNCNFTDNTASEEGGAVWMTSGTVSNCNFTGNTATRYGGAIYFHRTGTVSNCNFTGNSANRGGAVYFYNTGTVKNCNFVDNNATGVNSYGGAVYFSGTGEVTNCNFTDNTASNNGGAVYFLDTGNVTNCNFTGNNATYGGGAIRMSSGSVENCNFVDNSAFEGGAIYSRVRYTTADTCIFKRNSGDNVNTFIYSPTLNVDNFTTYYGSNEKLTFDLKTNSSIPVPNGNILISVYFKGNGEWVRNYTCLSGEGWIPDLPVGSYIAVFNTEYAEFQKINRTIRIIPNIKFYANVTSDETNNRTVNITAKSNIPQDILEGKLLFIVPNDVCINASYVGNGTGGRHLLFSFHRQNQLPKYLKKALIF